MDTLVRERLLRFAQKQRQSYYHLARRTPPGEHAEYLQERFEAWADAVKEIGDDEDVEEEDHQTGTTNEGQC